MCGTQSEAHNKQKIGFDRRPNMIRKFQMHLGHIILTLTKDQRWHYRNNANNIYVVNMSLLVWWPRIVLEIRSVISQWSAITGTPTRGSDISLTFLLGNIRTNFLTVISCKMFWKYSLMDISLGFYFQNTW